MSVGFGTLALFLPQAKYATFPSLIVSLNLFPYLSNEFIELGGLEMEISWSSALLCARWRTRFVIDVGSVTLLLRKLASKRDPERQHFCNAAACIVSALGCPGISTRYLIWCL